MKLKIIDICYYAKMAINDEIKWTKIAIEDEPSVALRRSLQEDLKTYLDEQRQVNEIIQVLTRHGNKPNIYVSDDV